MWWGLRAAFALIDSDHRGCVDRQPLVWIYRHTEEPGVSLRSNTTLTLYDTSPPGNMTSSSIDRLTLLELKAEPSNLIWIIMPLKGAWKHGRGEVP